MDYKFLFSTKDDKPQKKIFSFFIIQNLIDYLAVRLCAWLNF